MSRGAYAWEGGLAAHVQAACAAGALLLALLAYNSWRHEEHAKKRSEFATEMLKGAYQLQSCLDNAEARTSYLKFGERIDLTDHRLPPALADIEEAMTLCKEAVAQLKIFGLPPEKWSSLK